MAEHHCIVCAAGFSSKRQAAFYCSAACKMRAARRRKKIGAGAVHPGSVFVSNVSRVLDFCGSFGDLEPWSEHDPRAVAAALAKAIERVMAGLSE